MESLVFIFVCIFALHIYLFLFLKAAIWKLHMKSVTFCNHNSNVSVSMRVS